MTAAARKRRRQKGPRRARRWFVLLLAVVLGGAILALGRGVYQRFKTPPSGAAIPEPPPLDGVADPAVKRLLANCRTAVGQAPQSAAAWGKLGTAFFAHDYSDEAIFCFAVAERLDPRDARWPYFQGMIQNEKDPEAAMGDL
jgi:cytochrome c-type biogenesis protein CcmH/NrfG